MRLIDLDDVRHTYCGDCGEYERWNIDPNLLVDAVPVIRCKDCKYYSYVTIEGKHLCMSVKYRFTPTAEDEWCSWAERREE